MSDNEEERRVKARLDRPMKNFYTRKLTTRRKELPREDLIVEDVLIPNTSSDSSDDDVEDDTYMPSPRVILMGKAKEWQVLVALGQQGMRLRRNPRVMLIMMVMRRKKCLMLRISSLRHMLTWELLCLGCLKTLDGGRRLAIRARPSL
jgi:hypothetical protein